MGLAFPERWPRTFLETGKLTSFKIGAELGVIGFVLLAALGFCACQTGCSADLLRRSRPSVCLPACRRLPMSVSPAIRKVHGLYSLLGHLFKLLAYAYVYHVVFISCVRAHNTTGSRSR
ncbi:MASE3 domain-containing protein [Cupriavidus basilensis]